LVRVLISLIGVFKDGQVDCVFNYAVIGFENANGTITPLTGFIDVDATSSNTGIITDYDLFTNGKEFNFSGLTIQAAAASGVACFDHGSGDAELLSVVLSPIRHEANANKPEDHHRPCGGLGDGGRDGNDRTIPSG
jgi:hypothetical protein